MNNIISETIPIKQSGDTIIIKSKSYIYLSSSEPGYDISTNDYIIPITNSFSGYTLNGFISAINDGIQNVKDINNNPKISDFNINNSKSYIDNDAKFNLQLDINKTFSNDNYFLDVSGILKDIITLSGNYLDDNLDLSYGYGYTFHSKFQQRGTYFTDNSCILTICPSKIKYGNENRGNLVVRLDNTFKQSNGNYEYNNFNDLQKNINDAFSNFTDNGSKILIGTNISFSLNKDDSNYIDCLFIINIRKLLTQKYYRIQFCDTSANEELKENVELELIY
jgi:hypothetical protein